MCYHASDTTAAAEGSPGTIYAAGTYFNDKNTWWPYIGAFNDYIHRCCALLQRGRFMADLLYYIGDEAPAVIEAKRIREGGRFGYDYDDCNSEALLTRFTVEDKRLVTPDGVSYRVLVLPERRTMPLAVARKIREFVQAGVVVVGPKPFRTPGLTGYPQCDRELKAIADELWDTGKVIANKTESEVLASMKVPVDFAFTSSQPEPLVDFIHRQDCDAEIYFVINRRNRTERFEMTFRVTGKVPELWNALTGERRDAPAYKMADGRTTVPVELSAYGSTFVILEKGTAKHTKDTTPFVELKPVQEITGGVASPVRFEVGRTKGAGGVYEVGRLDDPQGRRHPLFLWQRHLSHAFRRLTLHAARFTCFPRPRRSQRHGCGARKRQEGRRGVVSAVAAGNQRGTQTRRQRTGNRGGQHLVQPHPT